MLETVWYHRVEGRGKTKKKKKNILDETVASATAILILLQLYKLELSKGFKDVLEVCFSDTEVDVAHIESVEGDRIWVTRRFRMTRLAVLLSLGGLHDDGNT